MARLRSGDAAALGEAYDAHHEHVRAFAQRLLGDRSGAEDLVQASFLALGGAVARFRGEASLRTLLVSIAVNHARHHLRAAMRRRAAHTKLASEGEDRASSPESHAARRQLADALVLALDELPLDQRVAIVLCEVEERTSAEVASIVGVPEATVRTRVFHAKRKLRDLLVKRGVR